MGMFDWVEPPGAPIACPNCGEPIPAFQTKDGPREMKTITDLSKINQFYRTCSSCKKWVQFDRKQPQKPASPVAGFDVSVGYGFE